MTTTHPSRSTAMPVNRPASTLEGTEDMSWKWAIVLPLAALWWVRTIVIARRGFDPDWIDKMGAVRAQIRQRRHLRTAIHKGGKVCPDDNACLRCRPWVAQIADEQERLAALVEACPVDVRWVIRAYRRWFLKSRPAVIQ